MASRSKVKAGRKTTFVSSRFLPHDQDRVSRFFPMLPLHVEALLSRSRSYCCCYVWYSSVKQGSFCTTSCLASLSKWSSRDTTLSNFFPWSRFRSACGIFSTISFRQLPQYCQPGYGPPLTRINSEQRVAVCHNNVLRMSCLCR